MNIKRVLLRKLNPLQVADRTESQTAKEIRKGLLLEVSNFCKYMEKNPYNNLDKIKVNSFEGLDILLRWAEQCQNNIGIIQGTGKDVMKLPEPQQVNVILKRSNGSRPNTDSTARGYTEKEVSSDQLSLILRS